MTDDLILDAAAAPVLASSLSKKPPGPQTELFAEDPAVLTEPALVGSQLAHAGPSASSASSATMTAAMSAALLAACGGGGGGGSSGSGAGAGSLGIPGAVFPTPSSNEEAARFLLQAQFSASDADIASGRALGYAPWLERQAAVPLGQTGWD